MAETPLEIAARAIDGFRVEVARLEDELAILKGAQARLGEEWEYEQDRARDAEAANAAMAAALDGILDWALANRGSVHEFVRCRSDGDTQHPALQAIRAALKDTAGEGWLPPEVREVLEATRHVRRFFGKWPAFVPAPDYQLWAEGALNRLSAALDALEVK